MKKPKKKISALFNEDEYDSVVEVASQQQCSLSQIVTALVREAMDAREREYDERDMREIMKDKDLGVDQEGVEINEFFQQLDDAQKGKSSKNETK